MTQRLKKSTFSASIALSLLVSLTNTTSSFAMESPTTKESTLNLGNLSSEFQKDLTACGHELLTQIYSNEILDLGNSAIYQEIYTKHNKEFSESQYSTLANYAPTNVFRWYWSSTDDTYIKTRKNQMTGILAITWALADLATKQNDTFERGSFTIVDKDHRLYNFLLDYVKLTTGFEDPQAVPYALTSCNFTYRRDPSLYGSSHHKQHCPQSQFGIDVRFGPTEGVLKLCPYNTTHLLFALLDIEGQQEPLLFLKWEDLGMGSIGATAVHSLGFHGSQATVSDTARREKDILSTIQQSFNTLKQLANMEGDHKTIRSMVLKANDLKEQALISKTFYDEDTKNLQNLPLSSINTLASIHQKTSTNTSNAEQQKTIYDEAESFLYLINELYPNGNNHLRCGNEVILDLFKI